MTQECIENLSADDLKFLVSKYSANKIFLVTGGKSYALSGAHKFIEDALKKVEIVRFFEFEQNPKYEDVILGVKTFEEANCDMIIAIGGGSVIDMAKLINVFTANINIPSLEIIKNSKLIFNEGKPLIAIPTTAGTGSEATHFAVVYHENVKYSVSHPTILPRVAILKHDFTSSQSPYLTACSGLDAFSQAIESYWSVSSTGESKIYAKEALLLLTPNLIKAVNSPDEENRKAIMKGAYLAGKAINISKTTGAHAISYAFTTYFSIPHGHSVFLTLPEFVEYNNCVTESDLNDPRGVNYVKQTIKELCDIFKVNDVAEAKLFLRKLACDLNVELSFKKLNIVDYENTIVSNVNLERMNNNPRMISPENLKRMLNRLDIS